MQLAVFETAKGMINAYPSATASKRVNSLIFGAVDYMVKPIDVDALHSKIERTLAAVERRKKAA